MLLLTLPLTLPLTPLPLLTLLLLPQGDYGRSWLTVHAGADRGGQGRQRQGLPDAAPLLRLVRRCRCCCRCCC